MYLSKYGNCGMVLLLRSLGGCPLVRAQYPERNGGALSCKGENTEEVCSVADVDIRVVDHSGDVLKDMLKNRAKALEMIGLLAEGYAKRLCAVDTGRLRNSTTHSTSSFPGVGSYEDNNGNKFNDAKAKEKPEENAVYIGTNVEYAPYVELGTTRTPEQPFLRPAMADHIDQYKETLEKVMKGEL